MTRVLALTMRPLEAADTRYRFLEYLPYLTQAGITVTHRSLLSSAFYKRQQAGQLDFLDALKFGRALAERAISFLRPLPYDVVWLGRELMSYGPPILERLLFRAKIPVVLDVDDALFKPDPLGGFLHKRIRDFKKFEYITPRCRATVVGSRYLADYYSKLSPSVYLIPTCVDHHKYASIVHRPEPSGRVRLGWIGTATNLEHLSLLRGPVERLARRHQLEFRAVGLNQPLGWDLEHLYSLPWTLERELEYFSEFDIGVMPLVDSTFTRGKCAFKLVQYMAAGLPAVASPVGANCETLRPGEEGFLAGTAEEWEAALETLILNEELRLKMGRAGRVRVRERYSLAVHWPRYAAILQGRDPEPMD